MLNVAGSFADEQDRQTLVIVELILQLKTTPIIKTETL